MRILASSQFKTLILCILPMLCAQTLTSLNRETVTQALACAAEAEVTAIRYSEKAGAFGIYRRKRITYSISERENRTFKKIVTLDQPPKDPEDPREPIEIGDEFPFSISGLIDTADPFNGALTPTEPALIGETGTGKITRLVYTWNFTLPHSEESYAASGELHLLKATGIPAIIKIQQLDLPEEIYLRIWELEFTGDTTGQCRLVRYSTQENGKYKIFRYKYFTTENYLY